MIIPLRVGYGVVSSCFVGGWFRVNIMTLSTEWDYVLSWLFYLHFFELGCLNPEFEIFESEIF